MKVIRISNNKSECFYIHNGKNWFFEIPEISLKEHVTFNNVMSALKRFRIGGYSVNMFLR